MTEEIINRVANSKLKTIDLEDFYPDGERVVLDIKPWLFENIILKEKDFRAFVDQHCWEQYTGSYLALTCSSDAIIPSWAFLLVASKAIPYARKVVIGNLELLETVIFQEIIQQIDYTEFEELPVIIKGCSEKPIPATAFSLLIEKLQPVAKSILFGEACSSVPIYKIKK